MVGPRPETQGAGSFLYIVLGLGIGTVLLLLIIKFGKVNIMKIWFFLAIFIATSISLGIFLPKLVAIILGVILAIIKIWRYNLFLHNIIEILTYAGIAVLLVPILNVLWCSILLIAISIYDFIAVRKSKHMIKMAKFQTKSKIFAGLLIPYSSKAIKKEDIELRPPKKVEIKKIPLPPKTSKEAKTETGPRTAILGGGDIAFPLLFTGVVMESFIRTGTTITGAFLQSLIIVIAVTISLALLFFLAKRDKFYPAMPILSAGCFIGYLIAILI